VKVTEVLNKHAREVVTISADSPFWDTHDRDLVPVGSLVRLFPPAGTGEKEIELALKALEGIAKAVRPMPAAPRGAVPVGQTEPAAECPGARAVIVAMAAEVPTQNRPALVALCESVMTEVKL
jgi:hypothetical protein